MKQTTRRILYSISLAAILLQGCGGGGTTGLSSFSGSSGNSGTDIQKPHITLNGDKTILLNIGDTFTDPGATALDNVDGDISSQITKELPSIDTSAAGKYEIIYSVHDKAGNIDTAKRKVVVMDTISDPESKKKSGIVINEVLATNSNTKIDPNYKQFSDYIELYNNTGSSQNIGGYYLSDDPTNLKKWSIPSTTLGANGTTQRLLIWADKQGTGLHTNFSLDGDGETLILSDRNGHAIDKITFKKQKRDISVTKLGDKNYYMIPTPGTKNKNALSALFKSKKPIFDKESGFYSGTQTVSLSQENGGTIYYTTDGSIPTTNSSVYSHPITVNKTTIIRARVLENGKFLSSTLNHTFLINENVHLPVVSIGIDHKYLFDDNVGIYTNFDKRGWRRPASIEFIGKDHTEKFSENIGITIFGGYTRRYSKKSLAIYAKDQFGTKSIDYPLFPNKPFIKKSKSFVLRTGGNNWKTVFFKDAVLQSLVKDHMDLNYQDYQPVILFINGQYWGISNMREKMNEDYLESNYNITDPVEILEKNGDKSTDYQALLANSTNYNYVSSHMDINNYLNYYVTEIYTGNQDWPGINIKYWKEKKPNTKWRWFLYDLDYAFYNPQSDDISYATATVQAPFDKNPAWSAVLFNNLLKNNDFKYRFLGKFITHMHLTFEPQHIIDKIDALESIVKPDMPRDIGRWKNATKRQVHTLNDWENELSKFRNIVRNRPTYIIENMKAFFNLSQTYTLTVTKPDYGNVFIDEAPVNATYSANYFDKSIVTLKAIPNQGHRFKQWSNGATSQTIEVTINRAQTLRAIFESAPIPKIVINEINYKSDKNHDSGDWVEIYNNDVNAIDLSSWKLKDDSISQGYTIPANTILQPGAYLVICEDKKAFKQFYDIQVLGDFPFGLSKSEDSVKLYNNQGALVDQVHYDRTWPDAKGDGKTLSLIDPKSDNSVSTNWIAADNFGTPGVAN